MDAIPGGGQRDLSRGRRAASTQERDYCRNGFCLPAECVGMQSNRLRTLTFKKWWRYWLDFLSRYVIESNGLGSLLFV